MTFISSFSSDPAGYDLPVQATIFIEDRFTVATSCAFAPLTRKA